MYRIMLADDEGLELNALRFMIERNFGSQCEVMTTRSGRGAIELADSFRPDIAIMDIQMPGLNGIYAMGEILPKHPDIQFIVLSAYDNFDYAQKSITLGVQEYLTKPVKKDVLLQTLRVVMARIDDLRQNRKDDLMLREKLETARPMLEHSFIYSVILNQDSLNMIAEYRDILGIREEYGFFFVMEADAGKTDSVTRSISLNGLYNKIRGLVNETMNAICGPMMGDKILCAVPCRRPDDEYAVRLRIMEQAKELSRKLRSATGEEFSIGIGSAVPMRELAESYRQAAEALRQKQGLICHYNDLPLRRSWEDGYPVDLEYRLYDEVRRGDRGALQTAEQFFDWMLSMHSESVTDVKLKILELVLQCEQHAFNTGGRKYHFMERHGYLERINDSAELGELRDWFCDRIQSALESVHTSKEDQTLDIVQKAEQYIREHFDEELSLASVAEVIHVSPPYVSKLFKEKLGTTFLEYLTHIRMERAKKMLVDSEKSIREIGYEVGYRDPNYFSRSFKKYEGLTPREYRER